MKINRKAKIIIFVIFLVIKFGYSQSENLNPSNLVFILNINEGAAISATLEYELINGENNSQPLSFYFHTFRMKKKFLSKEFREVEKIKSHKSVELTDELQQILNKDEILDFCKNEKDMTGMHTDGIYYNLQIKKVYGNITKECSVLIDNDIISKKDNEIGKLISKILSVIRFQELEKEFKENLPRGYYHNYNHYYWKKK